MACCEWKTFYYARESLGKYENRRENRENRVKRESRETEDAGKTGKFEKNRGNRVNEGNQKKQNKRGLRANREKGSIEITEKRVNEMGRVECDVTEITDVTE